MVGDMKRRVGGTGEEAGEWYRGYTGVLAERLREQVKEKGILPEGQARFRKGRGTVDNIYILDYLVNRQIGRKGDKLVAFAVDLKVAFDSVDRGGNEKKGSEGRVGKESRRANEGDKE
ncbi:hypothetical protein KM043_015755 [Ampulex compressa]|nr:hypothetical protein KM043_015755 [Ampulex compressa]